MQKKLITIINIVSIIISILFSLFIISIPVSASLIKITSVDINNPIIKLANDTLEVDVKYSIRNDGFFDLRHLYISVSVFTLNNLLIGGGSEGFPEKDIIIPSRSNYNGSLKLYFNLKDINALKINEEISKENAVKVEIFASGSYAFGLFNYVITYTNIFKFRMPIEEIEIKFDQNSFSKASLISKDKDELILSVPLIIIYKGSINFENITINGISYYNNEILFNFTLNNISIKEGKNNLKLNIKISQKNLIKLLFNDINIHIVYEIYSKSIKIKNSFNFYWKKPFNIIVENYNFDIINNTSIHFYSYVNIQSNLNNDFSLKFLIKFIDTSTGKLLSQKIHDILIEGNTTNRFLFKFILNVKHGDLIKIEVYMLEPFNIESPLVERYFLFP